MRDKDVLTTFRCIVIIETPEIIAESICSNGIPGVETDNYCCLKECGTCGGSGCRNRPGGKEGCCKGAIDDAGVLCDDSGAAPCIMTSGEAWGGTRMS